MRTLLAFFLCSAAFLNAQALRRAPGFDLPDTNMRFHDLADYRGKVVVLEFMQTACPHCARFADILDEIPAKYGDKVAVLSVVNVNSDNPSSIKGFAAGHKITFPIVMDQGQMMFSYLLSAKPADLPHVYIINASGYIRGDFVYDISTRDIFEGKGLFSEIDKVLSGK